MKMPSSTTTTGAGIDPISSALKRNFGGSRLDDGLQSALTKRSLVPVLFDAPSRQSSSVVTARHPHYILLNAVAEPSAESVSPACIPRPKVTFFRREDVRVGYKTHCSPGSGMMNVGNTCYLNSTLQALFHTPALVNYLNDGSHRCSQNGNGYSQPCIICALTLTLKDTYRSNVIRPSRIYEKLKTICKHLVHGRQEDAHEFLRYLIESLQKSFLMSVRATKNLDNASKETTPFNQIFGGYMRQDVTCVRCKYVSTTFQHFMDLLLDIRSASNVEEALAHYFRVEKLGGTDGSNMYKCEKCKVKVPAQKCSNIERPPIVLCIQLKRFGITGGKISKSVQLSRKLEMSKFIRNSGGTKLEYRLVSMITHVGPSPNCGHYTAIGEASNGQFYQFDDSHVRPVPVQQALNTASYVVMYEMTSASQNAWVQPEPLPPPPPPSISRPSISADLPKSSPLSNGGTSLVTNGVWPKTYQKNPTKKLVPYDGLDSSTTDDEDEQKNKVGNSIENSNGGSYASLGNTTSTVSTSASNGSNRAYPSPSFVPVSIALKQQQQNNQLTNDERKISSSGTWTVTDMDHHNPSIHSDNSSSSGGHWKISSARSKRPESDSEIVPNSSVNGPWNIKPANSDSEVGSPKKKKKIDVVKDAITTTWGKIFPQKNNKISSSSLSETVEDFQPRLNEEELKPTITNGTASNGTKSSCSSIENDENEDDDEDERRRKMRKKKRKKSFSTNGYMESPAKRHFDEDSEKKIRWDGTRKQSSVAEELVKQASFSEKVTSWDGSKSSTFSSPGHHRSRRDSRDKYDESLDRGRIKKVKRRYSDSSSAYSNGINPFQIVQQDNFNQYNRRHTSSSFKDYENRHYSRQSHHRNHSFRSHNGSFDESKYRRGGSYRHKDYNNHHYYRSRR